MNTSIETNDYTPDFVDYDDTDRERMAWSPQLKEGLFKTAVVKINRGADPETKNLFVTLTLAPLDTADRVKAGAPTARKYVELPLRNPKVPGHKPEGIDKKKFQKIVKAFDPGAFKEAGQLTKNDTDGKFYNEAGQEMTKELWAEYNAKVNDIVLAKAKEWYNNPKALEGAVCYTYIKRNEQYANIFWMASDPGGHAVITESFAG